MTAATTDYVHALLDQRVAGEAANKNLSDQIDLFFTAQKVQAENAQFGGVDKSVFQTTGGWAGTGLFGTPSAQELMGRMLDQNLRGLNIPNTGPLSQRVGLPPGALGPRIGTGGTPPAASTNPGEVIAGAVSEEDAKQAEDFAAAVDAVNSAMEAGGETAIKFKDDLGEITRGEREQALAQARLARERGLHGIAGALEHGQGRLRVEGLTGTPAQQGQQLVEGATAFQLGATKPDKAVAARLMAMQVNAQLQMNREQGRQQREWMIPGQSFLRQLYAGRAPGGARGGVEIPNPLTAGTRGLPPELLRGQFGEPGTAGAFTQNINTSQLTTGLGLVQTQANKGRDALVGMIKAADVINQKAGVPSNLLQQFNALTERPARRLLPSVGSLRRLRGCRSTCRSSRSTSRSHDEPVAAGCPELPVRGGRGRAGAPPAPRPWPGDRSGRVGFRQQTLALLQSGARDAGLLAAARSAPAPDQLPACHRRLRHPGQTPRRSRRAQEEAGSRPTSPSPSRTSASSSSPTRRESLPWPTRVAGHQQGAVRRPAGDDHGLRRARRRRPAGAGSRCCRSRRGSRSSCRSTRRRRGLSGLLEEQRRTDRAGHHRGLHRADQTILTNRRRWSRPTGAPSPSGTTC